LRKYNRKKLEEIARTTKKEKKKLKEKAIGIIGRKLVRSGELEIQKIKKVDLI
jgi:hypothetical protein